MIHKTLWVTARHPEILLSKKKYIFIMSHMRGYTSLLAHILGSNEEISGYSEMHQSYKGWLDLVKLRYKIYFSGENPEGKYLLDKILHNHHHLSESVINRKNVFLIFMIREPGKTLKSIINMDRSLLDKFDTGDALDYYVKRLEELKSCASLLERKPLFIQAEDLLRKTRYSLGFLTDHLHLKNSLKEHYNLFRHTGEPGYGDPFSEIKAGKVRKEEKDYSEIYIPDDMLNQASSAYAECRKILLQKCEHFRPKW